jgi:hypothetical protein
MHLCVGASLQLAVAVFEQHSLGPNKNRSMRSCTSTVYFTFLPSMESEDDFENATDACESKSVSHDERNDLAANSTISSHV